MKSQGLLPPQSFRRFQPRAQHRASPKISRRFVEPEEFTEFAYAFICSLEAGCLLGLVCLVAWWNVQNVSEDK